MSKKIAFADVVKQTIYFDTNIPAENLIVKLIDTSWVQRLRDIAQTGNAALVYMFCEHSRFGHSLGVASLACELLNHLEASSPERVSEYREAVSVAALLHDLGHLAPGSHSAFKVWYPGLPDKHEALSVKIIREDPQISTLLNQHKPGLVDQVCAILEESDTVPAWTHEIISGGGWNVDRGNWCVVDSVMAGVNYGRYNIPALLESIVLTEDDHLAITENRFDALMHFGLARHSMYRQIYQHRVLLGADTISIALAHRARTLLLEGNDSHVAHDQTLKELLTSKSALELSLDSLYKIRESWWRYHVVQWAEHSDSILSDLADRLINRKLFKTVRVFSDEDQDKLISSATKIINELGFDPNYYLHKINTPGMHRGDSKQSMSVVMDNGQKKSLDQCDPLWGAMTTEEDRDQRRWLVMPQEVKERLGRKR